MGLRTTGAVVSDRVRGHLERLLVREPFARRSDIGRRCLWIKLDRGEAEIGGSLLGQFARRNLRRNFWLERKPTSRLMSRTAAFPRRAAIASGRLASAHAGVRTAGYGALPGRLSTQSRHRGRRSGRPKPDTQRITRSTSASDPFATFGSSDSAPESRHQASRITNLDQTPRKLVAGAGQCIADSLIQRYDLHPR